MLVRHSLSLAALDPPPYSDRLQMNVTGRDPRVLVVEDDEEIAQVLQRSLRLEGYEVRVAGDGETAGGGTVIETWMLDTAPDPLADTARELAHLDAQGGRPAHDAGTALDRNARLYVS